MEIKLETDKGWTEAIIYNDCDFEKFYRVADLLVNHFNLEFSNKLKDTDTFYWDFRYNNSELVLHYNIYIGISIFPKAFKVATEIDNISVIELSALLFKKLIDLDWSDFENGWTIGKKGSENGTILIDMEHSRGARVTLEKDCSNIPFAITLGIYGLMFHTHFESHLEIAKEYIITSKFRINKIFNLYDVPEEERNEFWQSKHDRQINELTEMTDTTISQEKPAANSTLPKVGRSWWQKLFGTL
ncbi:Protein of unknown function [Pedobacter sp. ok626]|uniref:DUF3630 family protein n=1 Tax=Pedobacter sp. ok626 TaxID=1761882 RepID=UPI000884B75C|nr:DUF3630 family protein [Pedobacter sp. ok626]SDL92220.1 Protein of unknown function [Pedobacter sp. ok626]